jgi:hypothetical protein
MGFACASVMLPFPSRWPGTGRADIKAVGLGALARACSQAPLKLR